MKQKTYPSDITDEVKRIGDSLNDLFRLGGSNLRTLSKFSSMSVNSVKAVLAGSTANIASYSLVAKALGTNLVDVIQSLPVATTREATSPDAAPPEPVTVPDVDVSVSSEEEDNDPTDILL